MTNLCRIIAVCALAAHLGCSSSPSANTPDVQQPADTTTRSNEPLEDVRPLELWILPGHYYAFVRRVLLPDPEPELWMVCRPSFEREWALSLASPDTEESSVEGNGTGSWTLTLSSAAIWSKRKFREWIEGSEKMNPDDFAVERASIAVPEPMAVEFLLAWDSVVRRARNPKPVYVFYELGERYEVQRPQLLDGDAYEFRSFEHWAQSHSPKPGPAAELVAWIEHLAEAARSSDSAARAALLECCLTEARALRERTEALPW